MFSSFLPIKVGYASTNSVIIEGKVKCRYEVSHSCRRWRSTHTEILALPLRSLARTQAFDLKDRKIRVNTVSLGTIQTPNLDTMLPNDLRGAMLARFPMGRVDEAGEVARAVLFLASPENRKILQGYLSTACYSRTRLSPGDLDTDGELLKRTIADPLYQFKVSL